MNDKEQTQVQQNQPIQEQNQNQVQTPQTNSHSDILEAIQGIKKELDDIKNSRFSPDEIRNIAARNVINKEVQKEEQYISLEKRQEQLNKGKTALEIRNILWEQDTQKWEDGEYSRADYIRAVRGGRNDLTDRLCLALYRRLAPMYGVTIDQLNNTSISAHAENTFERRNSLSFLLFGGQ